jgi:hypothetical protein
MKILIKDAQIIPMTKEFGVESNQENYYINGNIAIYHGKISGIGNIPEDGDFDKIIDASGCVVLPGFINAHTHAAMALFRSYADDLPLMEWLNTKIWPIEAIMTGQDIYWGTMLSILEMIKSGTTTFVDMYSFMDDVARAVDESGIRAVLSRGVIGLVDDYRYERFCRKKENIFRVIEGLRDTRISPQNEQLKKLLSEKNSSELKGAITLYDLLKRPEISYQDIRGFLDPLWELGRQEKEQVEIQVKYEGYIKKQIEQAEKFNRLENLRLPNDIKYSLIKGLRIEAQQKLDKIRPESIGQASRISGVSPADISVLLVFLEQKRRMQSKKEDISVD